MAGLTTISNHALAGTHQPATLRVPEIEKGVGCNFDWYLLVPDNTLDERIAAAKAELGKGLKDGTVISLDPSVCVCTTMFRVTPQHPLGALENLASGKVVNQISVHQRTRQYSKVALDRMLSLR